MSYRDDPSYFSHTYRRRVDMGNPSWRALRALCFVLTWGRDTVFPFAKARQLDHLTYARLGFEIPLFDVVPLSVTTHRLVTSLRDRGLKAPTNLILRLAAALWLFVDIGLATVVGLAVTGHGGVAIHSLLAIGHFPHVIQNDFSLVVARYRSWLS